MSAKKPKIGDIVQIIHEGELKTGTIEYAFVAYGGDYIMRINMGTFLIDRESSEVLLSTGTKAARGERFSDFVEKKLAKLDAYRDENERLVIELRRVNDMLSFISARHS